MSLSLSVCLSLFDVVVSLLLSMSMYVSIMVRVGGVVVVGMERGGFDFVKKTSCVCLCVCLCIVHVYAYVYDCVSVYACSSVCFWVCTCACFCV